jgi:hypothetical protein
MIDWIYTHPKETLFILGGISSLVVASFCFGYSLGISTILIRPDLLFIQNSVLTSQEALTKTLANQLFIPSNVIETLNATNDVLTECVPVLEKLLGKKLKLNKSFT